MATYKEIHGVKVQYRDSDAPSTIGDVWYNASFGKLKMYSSIGAWASGTNLPAVRDNSMGFGTATAAQVTGGKNPGATLDTNLDWNGSSWSEEGDINTARHAGVGFGASSTTGLVATGTDTSPAVTDEVEQWDGSSWTEVNDLNTARDYAGGAGTVAAGLVAGGNDPAPTSRVESEEWNGTSWTEGNNLNTGKTGPGSSFQGTQSSALLFGGKIPPASTGIKAETEEYDGTSWTEVNDMNQRRVEGCGAGVATFALADGGAFPSTTKIATCEEYDGSSWTEVADLSTARMNINLSNGSALNCLAIGGLSSTAAVEEWDQTASVQTVAFD